MIQLVRGSAHPAARRARISQFYADDVSDFPLAARAADILIIKTHIPSPALQFLTRFMDGSVLVTIREPRDAIASLMQRFGHKFGDSLTEVSAGAAALVTLAKSGNHLLLRYEDRFCERQAALHRIARYLALDHGAHLLAKVHRSLHQSKVNGRIAQLSRKGVFGSRPDPDRFDPETHWHPGHIGDGQIGKYKAVLSVAQSRSVLGRTKAFREVFGYVRRRPGHVAIM
ncbi:MAG: hypothetical protein JO056_03270 [Alphaproteobacteria bacterium]|nr:hypothetical protein [Alphaproteobacteria bacterium]